MMTNGDSSCWGTPNTQGQLGINDGPSLITNTGSVKRANPEFRGIPSQIYSFTGFSCMSTTFSFFYCWGSVSLFSYFLFNNI